MSHWRSFLEADRRGGRYLPWKEVARATGLSRTTAWRLQKRDDFPAPYAISPGRVGYREDEVEAWRVSRDHSVAGTRSPTADEVKTRPADPVAATRTDPASSRTPPRRTAAPAEQQPPAPPPPVAMARPDPGVQTTRRRRRRSQHAQAIAQQMLFDF